METKVVVLKFVIDGSDSYLVDGERRKLDGEWLLNAIGETVASEGCVLGAVELQSDGFGSRLPVGSIYNWVEQDPIGPKVDKLLKGEMLESEAGL